MPSPHTVLAHPATAVPTAARPQTQTQTQFGPAIVTAFSPAADQDPLATTTTGRDEPAGVAGSSFAPHSGGRRSSRGGNSRPLETAAVVGAGRAVPAGVSANNASASAGASANASVAHASVNASGANSNASGLATPSNLHSALAKGYQLQTGSQLSNLHAGRLPRTSSLLPPPNLAFPSQANPAAAAGAPHTDYQQHQHQHPIVFQNPFNARNPIATTPRVIKLDDEPSPTHWQRPAPFSQSPPQSKRRPSRSSSAGGLSDGFRNLNRWSASTASSRASASLARRQSIDAVALQAQTQFQSLQSQFSTHANPIGSSAAAAAHPSPPRKLQKNRPSISQSPSATRIRPQSPSPAPVPPLESLPPIVALTSLEQDVAASGATPAARNGSPIHDPLHTRNDGLVTASDLAANTSPAGTSRDMRTSSHARSTSDTSMMFDRSGEPPHAKGHSRHRSQAAKGSADTNASTRSRDRSNKQPSQKAMLSRALQKANTAVQLDNARNFEGARQAYAEACELLNLVLLRTSGDEDRRKLEAISKTYTTRIEELDDILPEQAQRGKALPSRPNRDIREEVSAYSPAEGSDEDAVIQTATVTRVVGERRQSPEGHYSYANGSQRQPSISTPVDSSMGRSRFGPFSGPTSQYSLQSTFSPQTQQQRDRNVNELTLQPPMDAQYMPPPLSPRRTVSPGNGLVGRGSPEAPARTDFSVPPLPTSADRLNPPDSATYSRPSHRRGNSHESVSWLDPIDESGGSKASSVRSRSHSRATSYSRASSSMAVRRKPLPRTSGADTGADNGAGFDAALDDAIDAAYNDSYDATEMAENAEAGDTAQSREYPSDSDDVVARAMKRVELAKERVRESEREALELANDRERRLREQLMLEDEEEMDDFYDGNDSEEEERMLEEMSKAYGTGEFTFGMGSQARQGPRASDSSEFTARTWHTSTGSNPPTATTAHTALTTVSEGAVLPGMSKTNNVRGPLPPPPTQALPELPPQRPGSSGRPGSAGRPGSSGLQSANLVNGQGVRSRRLSGQNPKQLKIETAQLGMAPAGGPQQPVTAGPTLSPYLPTALSQHPQPKTTGFIAQQRQALSAGGGRNGPLKQVPSPLLPSDSLSATPPMPQGVMQEFESRSGSPSAPSTKPPLRKNFSSSSLKSMKSRNLSVSYMDDASDLSPGTPMSNQFGPTTRTPAVPQLPTPIAAAFKDRFNPGSTGGLYLFDGDFHSPDSPGSPNPAHVDAPAGLEPCPTDQTLRPFWLMRCLFQTLAHPRGGYVTNKLFVPRDAWKVKGVKLKNIEDKVANCDLLTAALQKLARVDTCDADALLEEMQSLETVLEQVQATLSRKLGSEVGVQSASFMFKDSTNAVGGAAQNGGVGGDGDAGSLSSTVPRSGSFSGKSSSFSWRRLRPKNSSAGLGSSYAAGGGGGRKDSTPNLLDASGGGGSKVDGGAVGGTGTAMVSLPMTAHPTSRPTKRDLSNVQFSGPFANYMSALARLFDAAQAIDQIARQVEDPGLRHADKTQVGLELCTRHAAEFFAFYVCRFVLSDLTMLLDKFVKRCSEWVLV